MRSCARATSRIVDVKKDGSRSSGTPSNLASEALAPTSAPAPAAAPAVAPAVAPPPTVALAPPPPPAVAVAVGLMPTRVRITRGNSQQPSSPTAQQLSRLTAQQPSSTAAQQYSSPAAQQPSSPQCSLQAPVVFRHDPCPTSTTATHRSQNSLSRNPMGMLILVHVPGIVL